MPAYLHQPAYYKLYPAMYINKWFNIQSMQKIVTTVTLQMCQWPAAFQPRLGNIKENLKREIRSGFFWNLQRLLGSCTKTLCPKQSRVSHIFIQTRKMGGAENTMATVNFILYLMIQPELAERWLQPAHSTQPNMSVWFLPKDHPFTVTEPSG
jgi:hypothetical protein